MGYTVAELQNYRAALEKKNVYHVSVYLNQIEGEGNITVKRVRVKFNHTVNMLPYETVFHEAYIYDCRVF